MPCSLRARWYGRSADPVACASSRAWPTPATLPCPKIPKQPGISRCRTPSRSLYWLARKRTSAWETVSRIVPTSSTSSGHRLLGPPRCLEEGGGGVAETFELVQLLVLVLDVHGHVRIDLLERSQELRPEAAVMPTADRDEVPRGVLRPAGHGVATAQQCAQLDRIAQVLGVLLANLGIGVQRVPVAVEGGQRHAGLGELPQVVLAVVLARPRAGPDVRDRQVWRGQGAAGVDLGTLQAHPTQDRERLRERLVVQDGGAGTELHRSALPQWISGSGVGGPASRKSKSQPSPAWVRCCRYSAP